MALQLTAELQQILSGAAADARRRDQARVTAEHLVLGMVRYRDTGRGLRALGLDLLCLADELERHLGEHGQRRRFWQDPVPRADATLSRVLQRAMLHALSAQQESLRAFDVLAALLREPGPAAELLRNGGLRRLDLLRYLEHGLAPGDPALRPAGGAAGGPGGDRRVILHNDHYTTMEFVSDVLRQVFALPAAEAERTMLAVHRHGSGVAGTYPHDLAAIKAGDVIELAEQAGYPLLCTIAAA